MLELIIEHQAGIPVLMQPLSGNSEDNLLSEDNLHQLAHTDIQGITRAPAILSEAQVILAQAGLQAMAALRKGYRYQELTSTYGGVEQCWGLRA